MPHRHDLAGKLGFGRDIPGGPVTWWMPVPKSAVEFTPVKARTGSVVHATTLATPQMTACGRKFRAWMIALQPLNCIDCKRAIWMPVKDKVRVVR